MKAPTMGCWVRPTSYRLATPAARCNLIGYSPWVVPRTPTLDEEIQKGSRMKKLLCSLAVLTMVLSLCGCDDDNSDSGPAPGVDVTGTWKGTSSDAISFTITLVQQPNGSIAGTVRRQEGYTGSASGNVSGNDFNMHVIWNYGGTGDYNGSVYGNAIEGTFDETTGYIRQRGTFTAFKQ